MRRARQLPHNLNKVIDITERYFRKNGTITPTTVSFVDDDFQVQEHEIVFDCDKDAIADEMVAAAAAGAIAVAFIAEAWFSERESGAPEDDPKKGEGLVIAYEESGAAYKCACKINRQRYGTPRLSQWEIDTVRPDRSTAQRIECIYDRAHVRRNTTLACDTFEPQLMVLIKPDGSCLRNGADEALVVSSLTMARKSIELRSNGGSFRCEPAKNHVDQLLTGGGFLLTSSGMSCPPCLDKADEVRAALERVERTMEVMRLGTA